MNSGVKKGLFIILGVYSFLGGFGVSLVHTINRTLPPLSLLEKYAPPRVTRVYDRNEQIIYEFYEERRIPVSLERIPAPLVQATLVVEDRRFYQHWGVNLLAIARAALANILQRKVVQGASTITQQLARNLFLTTERSFLRKLKEALLAINIERTYSKYEILEMYFNQIYFGNGAYGVETASQRYFGKHVRELTIPECALLAGIIRSPGSYSPYTRPSAALGRRSLVLTLMAHEGIISDEGAARLKNSPLGVGEKQVSSGIGLYAIEEIRKWVAERFGSDLLYRSGASIYTTLDFDLQKIAEETVKNGLDQLANNYELEDTVQPLQAALIAVDPKTGEILALVGGRDFKESMFNRAVQAKRQPGSAFKPFTWICAFDNSYTPASIILDEPIYVEAGDTIYSPHNYDHKFLGPVTLRKGLALSRNLVAVRLIMKLGPGKVLKYAKRMGITSKLEPVISLALGANAVSLLEMVSAYATLAAGGVRNKPFIIKEIVGEGREILYEAREFQEQVITPELAYLAVSLMESVLNEGTGIGARYAGFNLPAAGKTGTTNDYADSWFIGYTPSLICGVWIGYDEMKRIYRGATGARFALPLWTEFMKQALKGKPVEIFRVPPGIVYREICEGSGNLANPFCKQTREEIFVRGTEPREACTIHGPLTREEAEKPGRFERLDDERLKPEF